jgi:hypothetical protein
MKIPQASKYMGLTLWNLVKCAPHVRTKSIGHVLGHVITLGLTKSIGHVLGHVITLGLTKSIGHVLGHVTTQLIIKSTALKFFCWGSLVLISLINKFF